MDVKCNKAGLKKTIENEKNIPTIKQMSFTDCEEHAAKIVEIDGKIVGKLGYDKYFNLWHSSRKKSVCET